MKVVHWFSWQLSHTTHCVTVLINGGICPGEMSYRENIRGNVLSVNVRESKCRGECPRKPPVGNCPDNGFVMALKFNNLFTARLKNILNVYAYMSVRFRSIEKDLDEDDGLWLAMMMVRVKKKARSSGGRPFQRRDMQWRTWHGWRIWDEKWPGAEKGWDRRMIG